MSKDPAAILLNLQKEAEKLMIQQVVAPLILFKSEQIQTERERAAKDHLETAQQSLSRMSEQLGSEMKGKAGKKAKAALKEQSQALNEFT